MSSAEQTRPGARPAAVLVVGEALIDIVRVGAREESRHVGGSPANVALGLGRLGRPATLLTAIARDEDGTRIAEHVEAAGVTVDEASWSALRTPTALADLHEDGSAQYTFDVHWELPPDTALGGTRALHVGSIAAFLEPGASTVAALVAAAASAGAFVSIDPNIRPALVGDHESARARFEGLAGASTLVKLSDEDAAWLYPALSPSQTLDRIIALGARAAVVTEGGEGALLALGAERERIAADPVQVVDTIGAGDTFMTALIDGLVDEDIDALTMATLHSCAQRAARAAAITVGRAGADLPWAHELHAVAEDPESVRGQPWNPDSDA